MGTNAIIYVMKVDLIVKNVIKMVEYVLDAKMIVIGVMIVQLLVLIIVMEDVILKMDFVRMKINARIISIMGINANIYVIKIDLTVKNVLRKTVYVLLV